MVDDPYAFTNNLLITIGCGVLALAFCSILILGFYGSIYILARAIAGD